MHYVVWWRDITICFKGMCWPSGKQWHLYRLIMLVSWSVASTLSDVSVADRTGIVVNQCMSITMILYPVSMPTPTHMPINTISFDHRHVQCICQCTGLEGGLLMESTSAVGVQTYWGLCSMLQSVVVAHVHSCAPVSMGSVSNW